MLLDKDSEDLEFIEIMQEIGLTETSQNYQNCKMVVRQEFSHHFSMGVAERYLPRNIPARLDSLILLFKGLVICERDFKWQGGSVASNIKIMQWIRRKSVSPVDLRNLDKLIRWTYLNKGENDYTPFGATKLSNVSSLSELMQIEGTDRANAINQHTFEKGQMESAKESRKIEQELISKKIQEREIKNAERYKIFQKQIKQFQTQTDAEKLNDLLFKRISFPINLLPECEWLTIIRNQNLEAADINKLIKLIPKNTTSEIKQIKRFLQILRTPKLI